jgi:hypothetical protein
VDEQLAEYIRCSRRRRPRLQTVAVHKRMPTTVVDPCTLTLLTYLRDTLALVPVAAQVPVHSTELNFATAIDVLAVDAATRTRLYVLEIKAARMALRGIGAASTQACYKHVVAPARRRRRAGALDGVLGRSLYWQHQLQLWAMVRTLRREYALEVAGAAVIRTSPRYIFHYPLADAEFVDAEHALVAAFRGVSS